MKMLRGWLAENLGTTPDLIINNVLVWAVKKLAELSSSKQLNPMKPGACKT